MIVGDNQHVLKDLKYDSSLSLLLIDQGGIFNISLSAARVSLLLDYLLFGHLDPSTTFSFTQFFKNTPDSRPQIWSKIRLPAKPPSDQKLILWRIFEIVKSSSHFPIPQE